MDKRELETAIFTIAIFGLGAVALILYQHSAHTGQIVSAIQNAQGSQSNNNPSVITGAAGNPSAGGTVTGQDNLIPAAPIAPLTIGSNYEFD